MRRSTALACAGILTIMALAVSPGCTGPPVLTMDSPTVVLAPTSKAKNQKFLNSSTAIIGKHDPVRICYTAHISPKWGTDVTTALSIDRTARQANGFGQFDRHTIVVTKSSMDAAAMFAGTSNESSSWTALPTTHGPIAPLSNWHNSHAYVNEQPPAPIITDRDAWPHVLT